VVPSQRFQNVSLYAQRPLINLLEVLLIVAYNDDGHHTETTTLVIRDMELSQIACDAALILVTLAKPLNFFIHEGRP
jgi:hypothetical protein